MKKSIRRKSFTEVQPLTEQQLYSLFKPVDLKLEESSEQIIGTADTGSYGRRARSFESLFLKRITTECEKQQETNEKVQGWQRAISAFSLKSQSIPEENSEYDQSDEDDIKRNSFNLK